MSTFTDGWNGPESGTNVILFRKYIDELRAELTALAAKLPGTVFDSTNTVKAELDRIAALIPPISTKLNGLDDEITTKKLTVQNGADKLLEVYKDTTTVIKAYKKLIVASAIDVKNIYAGPSLFFDKYWNANTTAGVGSITSGSFSDYYVLAEIERVKPDPSVAATITLPCTLYVYNDADPKVSAVIYATETGLAVLHSGRDFPASGDPGDPPKVKYAVVRTGSSDNNYHYYVCMAMYQRGTTHVALTGTVLKVAMINAKPVTAAVSGVAMVAGDTVETTRSSDFLVSHFSITDLEVSDITINEDLTVKGDATLKGDVTIGTPNAGNSLTVNGAQTVTGNQAVKGNQTVDGTVALKKTLNVTGNTTLVNLKVTAVDTDTLTVKQGAQFTGTQDISFNAGIIADKLTSKTGSQNLISKGSGSSVVVGSPSYTLNLQGNTSRLHYTAAGSTPRDLAFLDDLVSSIIFEGQATYYSQAKSGLPALGAKLLIVDATEEADKVYHTVVANETGIAFASGNMGTPMRLYKLDSTGTWNEQGMVDPSQDTGDHSYQWHLDYAPSKTSGSTQATWHEAELIWSPHLSPPQVSVIETQLANYYTKPETDSKIKTFTDLATRQADWLATNHVVVDDRGYGVDNPAYIRNKPLAGISILDGGQFPRPSQGVDYPQFIVDGGDWDIVGNEVSGSPYASYAALPKTVPASQNWAVNDYAYVKTDEIRAGAAARYKITAIAAGTRAIEWTPSRVVTDIVNLRRDVIMKTWAGNRWNGSTDQLPAGSADTAYTLKWCIDTRELFMDTGTSVDDPSAGLVRGNKRINDPDEELTLRTIDFDLGTETPSFAQSYKKSYIARVIDMQGAVRTWKWLSNDERLLLTKTGDIIYSTLYLDDYDAITTALLSNQTSAITADNAKITWTKLTRGTKATPTPASANSSFAIQAGVGLTIAAGSGSTTTNGIANIGLTTAVANTQFIDTVTLNPASFKVTFRKSPIITGTAPTTKNFALAVIPNGGLDLTATGNADDFTAAYGIKPAILTELSNDTSALGTNIVYALDITATVMSFTLNRILNPSASPTIKTIQFAAGTGTKITSATANNATTITYDLADAVKAREITGPVTINTTAPTVLAVTYTSKALESGTPAVTKTVEYVAGTGLTASSTTASNKTTLTYSLTTTLAAREVTAPVTVNTTAPTILSLAFTSEALQGTAPAVTKTIEYAAGTGLTAVTMTANNKTTLTYSLDSALAARQVTGPVSIDVATPATFGLAFTSDTFESTTPTVKTAVFAAGTSLALTHATANNKTTVTYNLSADIIAAFAGVFIKSVASTIANDSFKLTFTSGQLLAGTDTTKAFELKAGTGVTFENIGTADAPIIEISAADAPVPSAYAELTFTVPDSGAQATIQWSKCGPVVSLIVFQTSGVGGTLSGTFTETLPTDIIPPVEVSYMTLGESGYRSITFKTDGHVDYLMDVGNAGFKTTLTYFVGA